MSRQHEHKWEWMSTVVLPDGKVVVGWECVKRNCNDTIAKNWKARKPSKTAIGDRERLLRTPLGYFEPVPFEESGVPTNLPF